MARRRTKQAATSDLVIGAADGTVLAIVPGIVRDEVRYVWTRLQVHQGAVPRSIGLTSSIPGEGVSFTSQALAAVLARTGSTCLVESNWWGHRLPFPAGTSGLADILRGAGEVPTTIVPTSHPGLSILPAGDIGEDGRSVMASTAAMQHVLASLHQLFTYVVVDLPAISVSATALSFGAAVESTLLVARQRKVSTDAVESAVNDLRHTRLLGVVVNASQLSTPSFLRSRFAANA